MKYIKAGKKVSVKLTIPTTSQWEVLDKLLLDLRIRRPRDDEDVSEIIEDLSSYPLSERICGVVRSRSLDHLFDLISDLEPQCILQVVDKTAKGAYAFFAFSQVGAFLKKYPFKGTDTKQVALESFQKIEKSCGLYNRENFRCFLAMSEKHPDFLGVIDEIRQDISKLIGASPDFARISVSAQHGPGSSFLPLYGRNEVTSYYKWSRLPYSVTKEAYPHAKTAIESDPRWVGALQNWYREVNGIKMWEPLDEDHFWSFVIKEVDGSRITTVPKSVKTDRTIAIEPLLNVFLQLGVDRVMRQQLRIRWGYDLNSQAKNQSMAREASISDEFATVDLSAASDRISLRLCAMLLPEEWFNLLYELRSPNGVVGGSWTHFEKISSMGNGFTFALESLIFGALVRCAIRRTRSVRESAVYGDDIVIPKGAYNYLLTLLEMSGFRVNESKTFVSGPFRESCGVDVFLGYNVRPVFLKRKLDNIPAVFYLHNRIYQLREEIAWTWGLDFKNTLGYLKGILPEGIRSQFYGPVSDSLDTHMFSERPLQKGSKGRNYWKIIPVSRTFNKGSDFFFRKLMASLAGHAQVVFDGNLVAWLKTERRPPDKPWEKKHQFDSGNAFDITKRGSVLYKSTRVDVP